jgi:hypothetical protein
VNDSSRTDRGLEPHGRSVFPPDDLALARELAALDDLALREGRGGEDFLLVFIGNDGQLTHSGLARPRDISMRTIRRLVRLGVIEVLSETDVAMAFELADDARVLLEEVEAAPATGSSTTHPGQRASGGFPAGLPERQLSPDSSPNDLDRSPREARRGRSGWRRWVGWVALVLIFLDLFAFVLVGSAHAPTALHLDVTALTDSAFLRATSPDKTAGVVLTSSVRTLDVLAGGSGVELDLPLDPATCTAVAKHLAGSCDSGFRLGGPLELVWSTPARLMVTANRYDELTIAAQPSRPGTLLSICAGASAGGPLQATVSAMDSGSLTIGDGSAVFAGQSAGTRTRVVRLTSDPLPGDCRSGLTAAVLVQGLGYPAAAIVSGPSLSVSGVTGRVTAGTFASDLAASDSLSLDVGDDSKLDLSFRPEDSPLRTEPDPVMVTGFSVDGIDHTPTLTESATYLTPLLDGILLVLVAVLGVAIVPVLAGRREVDTTRIG